MQRAQDEEGGIAVALERETEVRECVEGQGEEVDDPAADGVGKRGENGRGKGLENDVGGDCEIDGLG